MQAPYRILPQKAKCTRCRGRAEIPLPSHHANFCPDCFLVFFQRAVSRALKNMGISKNEPVLVAVSGGKDSLATWHILHSLGYKTHGLHLNLGIGEFSSLSRQAVKEFAKQRGLFWKEYQLKEEFGYSMPEIRKRLKRKICSVCGRLKRQYLNILSIREGATLLATGHNLDDEAARLLGNLLGNRQEYVRNQYPYLPSKGSEVPAKMKPLYRLEGYEIQIYCYLNKIEPYTGTCPFSKGATSHKYNQALDFLEQEMPGTKRGFLFAYLRESGPKQEENVEEMTVCKECGRTSYLEVCSLCSLKKRLEKEK